jgi:hypothetical protein
MKIRTFFIVAAVLVLLVVSAAVGGAVGGKNMHENNVQSGSWPIDNGESSSSSSDARCVFNTHLVCS